MNRRQSITAWRRANSATEMVGTLLALALGVAVGFAFRLMPASSHDAPPPEPETLPAVTTPSATGEPAAEIEHESADARDDLEARLLELKTELLSEVRRQAPTAQPSPVANAPSAAHPEMGERTLAYWNALNDIMLREEEMRSVPLGGLTAANARDFLRRRGQAGQFAADAIRKLPSAGVDPDVLKIAADIAQWYERGNELNSLGSFLLNKADTSARQGQPGQQWQDGEKAHQASVEDINRRGDQIRRQMVEKYGLAFPDLR